VNEEEIKAAVARALAGVAPESAGEKLAPAVNFRDQMDFDSMDFVAFVLALEKDLGVKVPELDYPKLSSPDGCVAYFRAPQASG
jgi:acyl carrier protein